MEVATRLDIPRLVEIYSYANTPRYLYRHFRENLSVNRLSKAHSSQDLTTEYRQRTDEDMPLEDVVVAYGVVIALTFLPYQDAERALSQLDLKRLDWGCDLKEIFESTARITNVTDERVRPRLHQSSVAGHASAASLEMTVFRPRPVVEVGHAVDKEHASHDAPSSVDRVRYEPKMTKVVEG